MGGEITYSFANFHRCTVEIREWISNFIRILYQMWFPIHAGIKVNTSSPFE